MSKTQIAINAFLGWILLNCLVVGAYTIRQAYKDWNPDVIDPEKFVASLSHEDRAELAGIILNYKEPTPAATPARRQ